MGCVCFAVNFYFYVYHIYDSVFVVCIMCEHVCIHFCSWNIELFIHFGLSRYVYKAIFSTPTLFFIAFFIVAIVVIATYTCKPALLFLSKTLISDWKTSVIHQHLFWKKKQQQKLFIFHAHCTRIRGICRLSITVKLLLPPLIFQTVTSNSTIFYGLSKEKKNYSNLNYIWQIYFAFQSKFHFNRFRYVSALLFLLL